MLIDAAENVSVSHEKHGHGLLKWATILMMAWAVLPFFGIGLHKTTSGDRSFDLWFLLSFMVIALVVMHEFIAPLPPKDAE